MLQAVAERNVRNFVDDTRQRKTLTTFALFGFYIGKSLDIVRDTSEFFHTLISCLTVQRNATRNEDKPDPCEVKLNRGHKGNEVIMFCRSCGAQIADEAVMCPQCGTTVVGNTVQTENTTTIPNHLVGSILATIFCCMPFGVPAIVFAAQVNSRIASGDLEGAMRASKTANMWMLISVGVGALCALLYGIIGILSAIVR